MTRAILCDFHKGPIEGIEPYYRVTVDRVVHPTDKTEGIIVVDCCKFCYENFVSLSELKIKRTRKPKAKVGRPRGTKNRIKVDETVADLLGAGNANATV